MHQEISFRWERSRGIWRERSRRRQRGRRGLREGDDLAICGGGGWREKRGK
jgi:hypothetical protein